MEERIILILYHEELNEKEKKKKPITFIVKRYNSQNNERKWNKFYSYSR